MKMRFMLLCAFLAGAALPCAATIVVEAPPDYADAVRIQQEHRFCENDIRSFVYHVFALYDKHVPVSRFLPLLADKGLDMRFPDATLRSHKDFKRWYAGIGKDIRSNTHQVERIDVSYPGRGRYQVGVVVLWQAMIKKGGYVSMRARQVWTLEEGKTRRWPRILSYIVEAAPPN